MKEGRRRERERESERFLEDGLGSARYVALDDNHFRYDIVTHVHCHVSFGLLLEGNIIIISSGISWNQWDITWVSLCFEGDTKNLKNFPTERGSVGYTYRSGCRRLMPTAVVMHYAFIARRAKERERNNYARSIEKERERVIQIFPPGNERGVLINFTGP